MRLPRFLGILFMFGAVSCALSCTPPLAPVGTRLPKVPEETQYEARFVAGDQLLVEIVDGTGQFERIAIEEDAEHFITELEAGPLSEEPAPVTWATGGWPLRLEACVGGMPCRIRYRVDVGRIAQAFQNAQFGLALGDDLLMPVTSFLVRPALEAPRGTFRFTFEASDDRRYWSGLASEREGVFTARLDDLPQAPFGAFSRERPVAVSTDPLASGDAAERFVAHADVLTLGRQGARSEAETLEWVRAGLTDAATYLKGYGARPLVMVLTTPGDRIGSGFTLGNGGASVIIALGEETSQRVLDRDWVMTHELLHASMPSLATRHNWLEEGFATYAEPLARSKRSRLSERKLWNDWYSAMWQGQPLPGDGGLEGTHAWGRLYWGGAGFWLAAELAVYERTQGKRTLADCFGAVARSSRGIAERWGIDRYLRVCDEGLGAEIVGPLHRRMSTEAVTLPFDEMFEQLGVDKRRGGVSFREDAPLAACRRNMTEPR